jgi:DNA-directed RNA polymerase specialized sigma24 family protein
MTYFNSTADPETRSVWLTVEEPATEEEVDRLLEVVADALGTQYQVVVTTDQVETLSRKDVAHFMGQMSEAMGLDVDITLPEERN